MPGAVVHVENKPPGHPPDAMWPPCPRQGHAVGPVSDVHEGGGGSLFLFPCRFVRLRFFLRQAEKDFRLRAGQGAPHGAAHHLFAGFALRRACFL